MEFVCIGRFHIMRVLLEKWADKQVTPDEYLQLLNAIPVMGRCDLKFILSKPIVDALREDARKELVARNLIRAPWEKWAAIVAIVLGSAASLIVIGRWIQSFYTSHGFP